MEVVLGFAVGYWIGTRQGRRGMQEALDSARAIWASPETRRLLGEGLSAFEAAAGPAVGRMEGNTGSHRVAIIRNIVDELIERRHERRVAGAA